MSAEKLVTFRSDKSNYVQRFGQGSNEEPDWTIPSDHSDEARREIIAYRQVIGVTQEVITSPIQEI